MQLISELIAKEVEKLAAAGAGVTCTYCAKPFHDDEGDWNQVFLTTGTLTEWVCYECYEE